MPLLSVLMPVRNGERFVRSAALSTIRALPRDSELVICDDGSSDGTPAILAEFASDKRVRVMRTAGLGVAGALNALLRSTDSQFVARMDADDVCLPWRFHVQLRALRDADVIFSTVIFVSEGGWPRRPDRPGRVSPEAVPLHLLMGNVLVHPTMIGRRSVIDDAEGYRETSAEDYDLWLRLANSGRRLTRIATPTLLYRRHAGQVSKTGAWLDAESDPLLDESYVSLLSSHLGEGFSRPEGMRQAVASGRGGALASDQELFRALMRRRADQLGFLQRTMLMSRLASGFNGRSDS